MNGDPLARTYQTTTITVSFNMKNQIYTFKTPLLVAEKVAEELLKNSLEAEKKQTAFHVSLSGGSTPKLLFKILSRDEYLDTIRWEWLHFWWGDERLEPYESAESNYGEAYRLLFSSKQIPQNNIHPVDTKLAAEESVEQYGKSICSVLESQANTPVFDWMILGLGDDGHTASLFPDGVDLNLDQTTALAIHPQSAQQRVSLTLKVINASKRISFLVTGSGKKDVLKHLFNETGDYKLWPSHAVINPNDTREWFLDTAAATEL